MTLRRASLSEAVRALTDRQQATDFVFERLIDMIFEHPELLIRVLEAAGYSVSLKTEANDATMATAID